MLAQPDAELAKRDPALAGLPTLLDPEALAEAIGRARPEMDLENVRATYVRYKPGTNCLVAYQANIEGKPTDFYAKCFAPDAAGKLAKFRERFRKKRAAGPQNIILDDIAAAVWFFPNDNKLPHLSRLTVPEERGRLMRDLLPQRPDLWEGAIEGLRYKPERRYVARLRSSSGKDAVVKTYTELGYRTALAGAHNFGPRGPLRIIRPLAHSDSDGVIVFEWLEAERLADLLFAPHPDAGILEQVGAALFELHGQDPGSLFWIDREMEALDLLEQAEQIGLFLPALSQRASRLVRKLIEGLETGKTVRAAIHGDFYFDQVLLTREGISILDLDRAAQGDPAADLGLFCAHLIREVLRGKLDEGRMERFRESLFEGYGHKGSRSGAGRVELYTAAGLIKLAVETFRHREKDWPQRMETLLERAEKQVRSFSSPRFKTGNTGPAASESSGIVSLPKVPVSDRFRILEDGSLSFLKEALDPRAVLESLRQCLRGSLNGCPEVQLQAIRVVRHKPGRRCLIEYDLGVKGSGPFRGVITLMGKVRARGLDEETQRVHLELWKRGFSTDSPDGISVPKPVGSIPGFHMWLYLKVPGVPATHRMAGPGNHFLAERIARAAHKLHHCGVSPRRSHRVADELRILHERLPLVAELRPKWKERLSKVLEACDGLGAQLPLDAPTGIHRDFYPDQVLVDRDRLYIIDLDMFCQGDPGLDIGNFLGHVTEQALRVAGNPEGLGGFEQVLRNRFLQFSGDHLFESVKTYSTLTLVRHIYISTRFPERQAFTGRLLTLCERRLGIGNSSEKRMAS